MVTARPTKRGLDYFPLDVGFLRDKKVKLLRAEFGASSVLFVLYVYGKAYEEDGYFLRWDKDEILLAADELKESPAYISEVLQGCLSRSLFDQGVFQVFGVLTSAGIQRRYLRGCEKRDVIQIASEYWLLSIDDKEDVPSGIRAKLNLFQISGGNNAVSSPGNGIDSPGNPQSKVKESKVKKRSGAPAAASAPEAKKRNERFVPPSADEVRAYCDENGYRMDAGNFVDFYTANGWKQGRGKPIVDWQAAVRTWVRRDGGCATAPLRKRSYHVEVVNGEEVVIYDT